MGMVWTPGGRVEHHLLLSGCSPLLAAGGVLHTKQSGSLKCSSWYVMAASPIYTSSRPTCMPFTLCILCLPTAPNALQRIFPKATDELSRRHGLRVLEKVFKLADI